jgi:fucose 4-O-acetylase-like acetyltransferase
MPKPVALLVAVVTSLVAGLWAGDILDSARILGLLPFFVLGLTMEPAHWDRVRSTRLVPVALLGVVGILVFAWFTDSWIATEWYYYRSRYDELHVGDLEAVAIRAVLLCIGLLGAWTCFTLVPRGRSWFTALGPATLVVYLCHGFFVLSAQYEGYPDWAAGHVTIGFVVTTLAAVLLATGLAAPPVARALQAVVDPIGWLGKRGDEVTAKLS